MPARRFTEKTIKGQVFNRWTVVGSFEKRGITFYWLCRCSCGTERFVSQCHLVNGASKSCGCWNKEKAKQPKTHLRTHGLTKTGLFKSWSSMKTRCLNPRNKDYVRYGGRGIRVSPEWLSFDTFLRDMGTAWSPGMTIERRDVNGNYAKGNCLWIPKIKQSYNRRDTLWVVYEGKKMCCSEASRLSGLHKSILRRRLLRGWPAHLLFMESGYVYTN